MNLQKLQGNRVLIVGYGTTGASVARYLQRHDIAFDVADEAASATVVELSDSLGTVVLPDFSAETFVTYPILVISPGVPRAQMAVQAAIDAGCEVIGDIELFAGAVAAPVIAVTGSNGKSTVVSWIASTLKTAGINAVLCGNIGEPALDSLDVDADVYVLELSSYQLESTYSLKPLSATVLNVSQDHMDRYDSLEQYAAVKRRILEHARHRVVNQDDQRTWPQDGRNDCSFFTIDLENPSHVAWHRALHGDQVWLFHAAHALLDQAKLSVPGDHNVANALAVLALIEPLAVPMNIPISSLLPGLRDFRGLPHRTQYLGERGGVRWYNDSKGTNVDACVKAVRAMPGPVVLIAGGISKQADFSGLRATVEQYVRVLVLIGQDRDRIASQLKGAADIRLVADLAEAIAISNRLASPGDVVLLSPACSSFDMFRNFEDRGEQFVAAVEEVLAA